MAQAKSKIEPTPWLGDIHYRDNSGKDVIARGAVFCSGRKEFDESIEAHLKSQGGDFLWSEEVHEGLAWFNKFGNHPLMAGLGRKVSAMHKVELSDPKAAIEEEPEDDSYLIIEEIEGVEPLDMQMFAEEKLTVPAALQEAMFGQPEPTAAEVEQYGENVPPMRTYAILDAAKMPYLLTTFLEGSGLEWQSLFQGEAQEELKEHAPYLVELEDGNDFVQKLFTGSKGVNGLWEKELGIFIRSRTEFADIRKHFRKFTKIQDKQGKWYYFRFWEAKHLSNILKVLRDDIPNSPFFYSLYGRRLIGEFVTISPASQRRIRINSEKFSQENLGLVHSGSIVKYIELGYLETSFEETAIIALKQARDIDLEVRNDRFVELLSLCRKLYEDGFTIKGHLAKLCFYKLAYNGKFDDSEITAIRELSINPKDKIAKIEAFLFQPAQIDMMEEST